MFKFKKTTFAALFLLLVGIQSACVTLRNRHSPKQTSFTNFINQSSAWSDSVYQSLSPRQRLAQLFMVPVYANREVTYVDTLKKLIQTESPGGLILFQGGPVRQVNLLNTLQPLLPVPALVAMDTEWGLGMRLDSTQSYPFAMALGAIQDQQLIYQLGKAIAADCKILGMHISFAPVLDVNNNPDNPVINFRSFGDQTRQVASHASWYMKGIQAGGIITTGKHFPGHGDTHTDSHLALPVLPFSRARLDSVELYPFKALIRDGIDAIMVGHLKVPALDSSTNSPPATLSYPITTSLLQKELGFKGLVITDDMDMKGITAGYNNQESAVLALKAGADIIEMMPDLSLALDAAMNALEKGEIDIKQIEARCKKVLRAKEWLGLKHHEALPKADLYRRLNTPGANKLQVKLAEASVTVLGKQPIRLPKKQKVLHFSIGNSLVNPPYFTQALAKQKQTTTLYIDPETFYKLSPEEQHMLVSADQIVVSLYDMRARALPDLGYSEAVKNLIQQIASRKKVAVFLFANPYAMRKIPGIEKAASVIISYYNSLFTQKAAYKIWMGKLKATGKLPVTMTEKPAMINHIAP